MSKQPIEAAHDADLRLSQQAMQRAAQRAREVAAQTGTAIVISHHGVLEQLSPETAAVAKDADEPPVPSGDKA